jgi:hypothetical protein
MTATQPYSAMGGKGGSMSGFGGAQPGMGLGPNAPQQASSPGKGVSAKISPAPQANMTPAAPTPQQPVPQAPQGPNALQTGLNAQNSAMDFFRNQMNGGGGGLMDMISGLSGGGMGMMAGGGGGGASGPAMMVNAPGKELYDYDPSLAQAQSYSASQLSDADINQYMNPYTQNVIDASMADLDTARMNALNNTGAAASRGGAFGGDRHGIMEAQNNADYMRQVASTSAQLRNQGFQNAQAAAMSDINAMNQQRASNAGMAQQAALENAAAQNARDQFVGSLASQNEMAAQQANQQSATQLGAASIGAGAQTAAAAMSQMGQNQRAALEAALRQQGMQFDAANQLYGMGNDRWNMGQSAINNMGQVGSQIDNLNQTLIDQQMGMFMNQQGAPQAQYQQMLGALGALSGGGTQSYNPGVFDYLKAGTSMFGIRK